MRCCSSMERQRHTFMVFSSLLFLFLYLPIVLILYFLAPRVLRNLILFLVSLVFYAWGEPVYVVIMLFSTLVDYTHGLLVDRFKRQGQVKRAKAVVASSMVINLALLGFFKYSDFFIQNLNALFRADIPLLELALPIGISFYTFQTMSYTIDVYRGDAEVQKNIISFGAYVTLFPQLIAGPIVQYKTIAQQLDHRRESLPQFDDGVTRFMTGLGKKVFFANNIGYLWDTISAYDLSTMPALTAWIGIFAFAFQIYFDFSGYSDMAIGLGKLFGFEFLENFNYPYLSKSITEFWRRWHISLGTWFREYVYIPLGGNRCAKWKHVRNILAVWLLTGFWHGASWNFVVWGVYFGVLLIVEKFFLLKRLERAPALVRHGYTMFFVLISWVIFAFDDFSKGFLYLKAMFGLNGAGFFNVQSVYLLITNLVLLALCTLGSTDWPKRVAKKLLADNGKKETLKGLAKAGVLAVVFLVCTGYLVDSSFNPFLYFRF